MRHFLIVGVLVALVSVLTFLGLQSVGLMPKQASLQSGVVDWMFTLEFAAISFLFALVVVPLFYSLVVFRRKPGETGEGEHIEGNTRLEITWTVIPLFVVLVFAYLGADTLGQTRRLDPNALVVNVTAFQWAWRFEYPDYGIKSNQLYLPVNRQVVLKMQSPDVIHSFWVPEFRIKQDVVPGRVTEYRITPSEIGQYKVQCAELCGASHAYMVAPVIVVSQGEFDQWVQQTAAAQATAAGPDATRGQKLYNELGCKACHSVDGSPGVGPTWKGLWGGTVQLADGSTLIADEAYIIESIRQPNAKIVAGFQQGAMPAFAALSDAEIADIIEFIKTLK
uniref:Cytochrome c oxidase subunit 2 n=1 Tax=uncultured Chloroflexota bacterium TaxID=166587 RepID=H5SDZ8_9CHLR|nr:cytochrome c oxidase subunit II [uncultured Chloroflexota bacterium]